VTEPGCAAVAAPSAGALSVGARAVAPGIWLLLLGALLALPAGTIAAVRSFDGLYGQDAYAYFDYAVGSVRQSLLHVEPLESFFWPPGYPLLAALTSLVIGPSALAGQAVSLLMGALTTVLTALLVRELWPERAAMALLAGALVALCGQLWQSSVVVMADTAGLALAIFGAWALARFATRGGGGWLMAAGAAIAYATLARWIYALVAVPFCLYALGALGQTPAHLRRPALFSAAAALGVALIILGPVVGPPLVGLHNHPNQPAAFAGNFQVYSWSPLNALRREFQTADGHLEYALPNGVYYAIAPANLAYFGPLLAAWLLVGVWAARRWPRSTLLLIAGWAAIVYAFHAGAPWQNFRFTLAYLPPLAILLSAGVVEAWRQLGGPRQRGVVAAGVGLGLLIQTGGAVRLLESFIDRKDQDLALVRWVAAQAPADAQLFSFGPTLTFRHYTSLTTFDLFDLHGRVDIGGILASPAPHYLLVDEASLHTQWQGQAPEVNFALLRDGPGLTRLGSEGGYTLFRVGT
jgi:4-amino-4-deoxy-L-arabinose transferase-like glycosyltransferase